MHNRIKNLVIGFLFVVNMVLAGYLLWPEPPMSVSLSEHPAVLASESRDPVAMIAESGNNYALIDPTVVAGVTPKVFKRFKSSHQHSRPTKAAFHGTLNMNTAGPAELQKLPGIGPAMASRIVAYRKAHGPFASLSDLGGVSGIGPKKLAKLAPFCKF